MAQAFLLTQPPCQAQAQSDGIMLAARNGPGPFDVTLEWTGGEPYFEIFRSSSPADLLDPSHKLGEISGRTFADAAEIAPGGVLYYVVSGGLDRFPPVIIATAAPAPNANGWNSNDVVVSFECSDTGSGIASCPAPFTVSGEGSSQVVSGAAVDLAGNSSTTSLSVSLDRTIPALTITAPNAPVIYADPTPEIRVEYWDGLSGPDLATLRVLVDGVLLSNCQLGPSSAVCEPPPLPPGAKTVSAEMRDRAGNPAASRFSFELSEAVPLEVRFLEPVDGLLTRQTSLRVSGTVSEQAGSVTVNGLPAILGPGTFTLASLPLIEGNNTITATATNSARGVGTASITVVRDTTPPSVAIESPAAGQTLTDATATIVGLVNDIVTGTVNAGDCRVVVSGRGGSRTAAISNRTFLIEDFPLVPGPNSLTALATDRAGNESAPYSIQILRSDPVGQRLRISSGDHQTGSVGSALAAPLVVNLTSADGSPMPGRAVTFTVTRGDGSVASGGGSGRSVTVQSDASGQAAAQFNLGTRAGVGNQRVAATSTGFVGNATFVASALSGAPAEIKTFVGEAQTGAAGRPLPDPFVVFVHDTAGNAVEGVPVTFQVSRGSGSIGGSPSVVVPTDGDGRARMVLTLGLEPGIDNNLVEAGFPAMLGPPATLTASALAIGPAELTSVSGIVLDNSNVPVPNATMKITGTPLETATDGQGRFSIPGAPVGTIGLEVDATTTPRPGTWPVLHFMLTTVSGQDNTLGMPIYVLTIDTPSARLAGGSQDVTLTMSEVPGVALTVFANSVTCPDGSRQCMVSISQVHSDKVPMPPPGGAAPRLIWTVQPAGARFSPPARITYPNLDGLAPGAVVEVMSFDHDLGQYVSVGTATVSADGSVITSDPGGGIAHAGWGFPTCRPPVTTCGAPPCTPAADPYPVDCKLPVGGDPCSSEGCTLENLPDGTNCGTSLGNPFDVPKRRICKFCLDGACLLGPQPPPTPLTCDQTAQTPPWFLCQIDNVFLRLTGSRAYVTFANSGTHSGGDPISGCFESGTTPQTCSPVSYSWHYCDRAFDLRSQDKCLELSQALEAALEAIPGADARLEFPTIAGLEHIHVQFPVPDNSCRNGVVCGGPGQPACIACQWKALAAGQPAPPGSCGVARFGGGDHYLNCAPQCPPGRTP